MIASYGKGIEGSLLAEAHIIMGNIDVERGNYSEAHAQFQKVLLEHHEYEDARLQLRLLESRAPELKDLKRGFFSGASGDR